MTAPASLQKCLDSVLDRSMSKRYLRSLAAGAMPSRYYYNTALRDLNAKDSEGAIHHLILALSTEPGHEPSLHLVKTMLFGLSKKFHDSGGETYKQRYGTLGNWVISIEKQIAEIDKKILLMKNDQLKEKSKGLWSFIEKLFKGNNPKSFEQKLKQLMVSKEDLKKQMAVAAKIAQIEEYAKVLSLILEICLYPARYAWVVL